MVNGVDCRCGDKNALLSYIQVNDNNCNLRCRILTADKGMVPYPCGGNGFYTVYNAFRPDYNPPSNITLEEKLNIMNNIDNVPHYKGCFEDNKVCRQRNLGDDCHTPIDTIDGCIDYCREGNFTYAGLESRSQCFCGNSYVSVGHLKSPVDCSASCPGNSSQLCGGEWLLSIYEVRTLTNTPLPPTPPSNTPLPTRPSHKSLIIGLSVGLGTLIIVTMVGFLIYRKRSNFNNDDPNKDDPNNDPNNEDPNSKKP
ncbi:WSC domain-containing protein [Glomus cerebriforme]|nr:WSC domain-containing protein [Glomus cerebriforme]